MVQNQGQSVPDNDLSKGLAEALSFTCQEWCEGKSVAGLTFGGLEVGMLRIEALWDELVWFKPLVWVMVTDIYAQEEHVALTNFESVLQSHIFREH